MVTLLLLSLLACAGKERVREVAPELAPFIELLSCPIEVPKPKPPVKAPPEWEI